MTGPGDRPGDHAVTLASAAPRADTSAAPCMSCGAPLTGAYCANCGQRVMQGRHTLRRLLAGAVGKILNLEGGLLYTAGRLTVAPAGMVRDYLSGRTAPYLHPAGYLLVSFAAFALLGQLLDLTVRGAGSSDRMMTALVVPFIAAAARLVFLRGRLNYAEHLIAAMYLLGHIALMLAALQLFVPLLGARSLQVLLVGALLAGTAYFVRAYVGLFPRRRALAAVGGFISLWGGVILWAIALMMFVQAAQP